MSERLSVRVAVPEEAEAIASTLEASFREHRSAYTDRAYAATTPTGEELRVRWAEGPVWIALLEGTIVGTVSAVERPPRLYVRSMAVLPGVRGLGIGALLLRRVENFAAAMGCTHLVLSTTPFLWQAIRLYEKCGFRPTGAPPHELFGTPLVTMVKDLERSHVHRS